MSLFEQHKPLLLRAIEASKSREFWTPYPENPRKYPEGSEQAGRDAFARRMNEDFMDLLQTLPNRFEGEEISPWLGMGIGVKYPVFGDKLLVKFAQAAQNSWMKASVETRVGILLESLERMKERFFEIAYATMHTSGQSFMMAFQASGPHAADRALEAVAVGYEELTRYETFAHWVKPQSKSELIVDKVFTPFPKGVNLVIGCSTFPVWNTVPGMFAGLVTGNPVIVKPHSKAVLPIAIVVSIVQKVLEEQGFDPKTVQLGVDTFAFPITRDLIEHPDVKIIDYTGNTGFGNWIETQQLMGKTVFTEKAGVNSVLLHSTSNYRAMIDNLAFAITLYSGQMCTSPQNFFIPEQGMETDLGLVMPDQFAMDLRNACDGLLRNPKIGFSVSGAIQNDRQLQRRAEAAILPGFTRMPEIEPADCEEFEHARLSSPMILLGNSVDACAKEWFGPIYFVIATNGFKKAIQEAARLAKTHGAISCGAYTTDEKVEQEIAIEMGMAGTQVCFNYLSGVYVNQNAGFSDFHLTGANPAGNASFTNGNFVSNRFVWIGHRYGKA